MNHDQRQHPYTPLQHTKVIQNGKKCGDEYNWRKCFERKCKKIVVVNLCHVFRMRQIAKNKFRPFIGKIDERSNNPACVIKGFMDALDEENPISDSDCNYAP